MSKIFLAAVLVVIVCVSQSEAVYTRLIYNNADCSGFHVAYSYSTYDTPCTVNGCAELYPGKFWVKEVCGTEVTPRYQDGFSVIKSSTSQDCSTVNGETGALADTCVVFDVTSGSVSAMVISSCTGDALNQNSYGDANCTTVQGTTALSKACTAFSVLARYVQVTACPIAGSPTAVNPYGSSPLAQTPAAVSTPSGSKQPAAVSTPSGSKQPAAVSTPSGSNQPASTMVKSSSSNLLASAFIFATLAALVTFF